MSIIYDALKKVEDSIDKIPKAKEEERKSRRKVYLLYVLFACLGFIIANTFFNFITKTHQSKISILAKKQSKLNKAQGRNLSQAQVKVQNSSIPTPVPLTTEVQKPPSASAVTTATAVAETKKEERYRDSFTLNGVFFSQDKGYALINNKIAEEGDNIDGATVMRINLDGVELKSQNGLSIKLSNSNQ